MQTMGSELCISDSALIQAQVEEKGIGGDPDLRKQKKPKIDAEVEEKNDHVCEEDDEDEGVDEEEEEDDDDDENDCSKKAHKKLNKDCISDSALVKAEVEEGIGGDPGLRKPKIDAEVEEKNEDVYEEDEEDEDDDEEEEEDDEEYEDVDEEEEEDDNDDEIDRLAKAFEKRNKMDFISEGEGGEMIDYIPEFVGDDVESENKLSTYKKYRDEFLASNGFDIKTYLPDYSITFGLLQHVNLESCLGRHCEMAVKKVLKFQNRKNDTNLKYVKVIQANASGCGLYYVTFEAEDTISRKVKVFQSKVYHCPATTGCTTIWYFSEKKDDLVFRPR
ncbi:hypothetical protein Cni_G06834 [Canna indica]|uniref:Cystatin domain-containing protein n=1 Tax=Canna indica TaxID=4628 RepID=A0AAQ3Q6Y1_9LILI|nr:hypothetical protein Cni_G06834 [Canna indica]